MSSLVIMRGLPGSGKSTLARVIVEAVRACGDTAVVCSTDDFRYCDRVYCFDQHASHELHCWNQFEAEYWLQKGVDTVIVDNTNIRVAEMQPYIQLATKYGREVFQQLPATTHAWDPAECFRLGRHRVPVAVIQQMASNFEAWNGPHYSVVPSRSQ
jgi:predicted kinase